MARMGTLTFPRVIVTDGAGHYFRLPKLTSTQRDALTAVNGMVIYQSTSGRIETYENGAWVVIGQVYGDSTFLKLAGGTMAGNIVMGSGLTVDGIDISAHAADGDAHANGGSVIILPQMFDTVGQGTWSVNVPETANYLNGYLANDSVANGDNVSTKVYLPKGTYKLFTRMYKSTDRGIAQFLIDNVEVASLDIYAAVGAHTEFTQASISIAASGLKTLKLNVNGKNASSSGFAISLNYVAVWRTA